MIVAVHAHGTEGIKRAVLAGVDSIEHGTFMTDEVIELMKQKGTYWVPTNWPANGSPRRRRSRAISRRSSGPRRRRSVR